MMETFLEAKNIRILMLGKAEKHKLDLKRVGCKITMKTSEEMPRKTWSTLAWSE